jgi:hypothetical protein
MKTKKNKTRVPTRIMVVIEVVNNVKDYLLLEIRREDAVSKIKELLADCGRKACIDMILREARFVKLIDREAIAKVDADLTISEDNTHWNVG